MSVIVGTAGWSIPSVDAARFESGASALERYATRLMGVEINSSFYRPHRPSTWARWRDTVPADFRFAVKLPKVISHERRLVDCAEPLGRFLDEVHRLEDKLAVLLLQLPPLLTFDKAVVSEFLEMLSAVTNARVVCEPRHPSWFESGPDTLLGQRGVARVAADPARVPLAAMPGGWRGLSYWRWHGSPQIYRSRYDDDRLDALAGSVRGEASTQTWCIFDNTAASAALGNALTLSERLRA